MLFDEDSNFRKAKKTFLVTSTINLILALTALPIEEINFGIVKFAFQNSINIYYFLIGILIYQFINFYIKYRVENSKLTIAQNEEKLSVVQSFHDTSYELETLIKDYVKRCRELSDMGGLEISEEQIQEISSKEVLHDTLEKPILNSINELNVEHGKKAHEFVGLGKQIRAHQNVKSENSTLSKLSLQEVIIDFWVPLVYGLASIIIMGYTIYQTY